MDWYDWNTFQRLNGELRPWVLCEIILRGWWWSEVLAIVQRGENYLYDLRLTISWEVKDTSKISIFDVMCALTLEAEPENYFKSDRTYNQAYESRKGGEGGRDEMKEEKKE